MMTNIIILEHNEGFGNVRIIKKTGDNGYEEQYHVCKWNFICEDFWILHDVKTQSAKVVVD